MSAPVTDGGGRADHVFQAIIDLLIPGKTPGIKEDIVDLYEKPEILFFGPDEGTADMMDWAASKLLL
jgi:NAD-specific glutamate dehydrogenase